MSSTVIYTIFLVLVHENGKLFTATEIVVITTCDGGTKASSVLIVKYSEIKQHCDCKIEPHFVGVLQFASNTVKLTCYTEINIFENAQPNGVLRLVCGDKKTSGRFNVTSDSILFMTSKYVNSTTAHFYQEITIFEEKTFNGKISVTCGGKFSTTITTSWTTNTDGKNHSITTNSGVSLKTVKGEIKADYTIIYFILGAAGSAVALSTVIAAFAVCHLRQKQSVQSTTGLKDEINSEQKNTDIYKELPDNPLYHSYRPEDEESQIYAQPKKYKEKTQIEDVRKSVTQANSSNEDDCDIVYAKVNKQ